jgi:glycosyltransferase involved in cell wall biosynthesis
MTAAARLDVVQVAPWERQGGGEQIAASLACGLRERGHRARLVVGAKASEDDPNVIELPHALARGPWFNLWNGLRGRFDPKRGAFSRRAWRTAGWLAEPGRFADWFRGVEDFRFPATRKLLSLDPPPDVVHLHNLHGGYFDLRVLPELSAAVPTFVTLHDAWMLSGHCAHSMACERWQTGCGQCPDLSLYPSVRRDATKYNWNRKRDVYARSRLHVATPSRWLMDKVERSMLAPAVADARVIPNGVDLGVFRPRDRSAARAALGINPDAAVLVFAANGVRRNPFKDYRTLREAFGRLAARTGGRELVLLALGDDAEPERVGDAVIRFVPFIADPAAVSRYFCAADVYVHAALVDTFPTTVLEALACGTPVVATAVGGIPEQLNDGQTGFLVPPGDAEALAAALARLLADPAMRNQLGEKAACDARERFDVNRQCEHYLAWYSEILSASGAQAKEPRGPRPSACPR